MAVAAAFAVVVTLPLANHLVDAAVAAPTNPDLSPSCGLDVTLVLDDSNSIDAGEATQVRSAAQLFADALVGTPSRLKTVVLDDRATGTSAAGTQTSNLNNVVFRDPASYTAPTSGDGQNGTNWDDGLEAVRRSSEGPGDLVVFITDGDPTRRNSVTPDGHLNDGSHAISGNGSSTSAADLANAVVEADLIKAGTHLFGIGIGFGSAASEQRLAAVTGPDEMTISGNPPVPNPSFGTSDYIVTPNFSDLKKIVSAFTRELCGDSLNVTKFLQKADGTTVKADGSTPWEFETILDPAPASWERPVGAVGASAKQTTDQNGGVSFVWDRGQNPTGHTADVLETGQSGWVYNGAKCTRTDFSGGTPEVLVDTVGPNTANSKGDPADLTGLVVSANKAVNCEVYNRQVRKVSIEVEKKTVPANSPGGFSFELSDNNVGLLETVNGVTDGQIRAFAPVGLAEFTVTELAAPGFTQTSASCDRLNTAPVENFSPVAFEADEGDQIRCTFVNTAAPSKGTITVRKAAVDGDGTFSFTSDVPGLGNFDLTTVGGAAQSATVEVPGGTYSIAESVPAGWNLTGSICTGGDPASTVTVSSGEDVICTFTNVKVPPAKGSVTVKKVAVDGDGTFSFTSDVPGLGNFDLTTAGGTAETATIVVEPGNYAIGETVPDGWNLTDSTCTGGDKPSSVTVSENEAVVCTFTNTKTVVPAAPTITVKKNTVGGDGTFSFISDVPGLGGFGLTTAGGTGQTAAIEVVAGTTYGVSEVVPQGWKLTSASCTGGDQPAAVTLLPGENVVCTFVNEKELLPPPPPPPSSTTTTSTTTTSSTSTSTSTTSTTAVPTSSTVTSTEVPQTTAPEPPAVAPADEDTGYGSGTGPGELARTGSNDLRPLALVGVTLVLLGAAALWRRRTLIRG